MPADPLTFIALSRQLQQRRIVIGNIANLARTLFKPKSTVRYNVLNEQNIVSEQHGRVVDVFVEQYQVYVNVEALKGKSKKPRRVEVSQITGVM